MSPASKDPKAAEKTAMQSALPQKIASRDRDNPHSQRAFLNGLMHLTDKLGLDLRLPLFVPGDECATHLHHKLLATRVLRPAPEISQLVCPLCDSPSVDPVPSPEGKYEFYCGVCDTTVDIPGDSYKVLALSLENLFALLVRGVGADRLEVVWELLPEHLWMIGEIAYGGQSIKVLFARVSSPEAEARVLDCLLALPVSYRCLVLLSREADFITSIRERLLAVVLSDVAMLDVNGFHLHDREELLSRFKLGQNSGMRPPGLDIEVEPEGRWVRLNGVRTHVTGKKQRQFVLAMAAAFRKGDQHPRLEKMLTAAGYSEGTSELKHISQSEEFLSLFGYGNGEVWFKAPVPL